MGLRRSGGRTYARGGGVKDGPAYQEGVKARPVEHHPGKQNRDDIGRPKAITYKKGGGVSGKRLVQFWVGGGTNKRARGGAIEHPKHQPKGPGGFGLGSHARHKGGINVPGHGREKMAGGLEPPKGPHHGGGHEAPHHPRKSGPTEHPKHGGMTPNFGAGSGGGTARLKKIKFERAAQNHLP